MGRKGISIHDVARMAGVSAATVSNVINGKSNVSDATRKRVREVMDREGYRVNYAARALRESRSRMVGIVTPDISNPFFASIARGLERELAVRGYACCICNTDDDQDQVRRVVSDLAQRQVDGLAFVGGNAHMEEASRASAIPTVFVNHAQFLAGDPPCPFIDTSWEGITRDAVTLLAQRGCARVGIVVRAGSGGLPDRHFPGFAEALRGNGLDVDPALELVGPASLPSRELASQLVGGLLDSGIDADGIFVVGDRLAVGVYDALFARGLLPGDDVRVVGVDNSELAAMVSPGLSSVERHTGLMAERGAEELLAMLAGSPMEPKRIVVPHVIVERESTLGARQQV